MYMVYEVGRTVHKVDKEVLHLLGLDVVEGLHSVRVETLV